MQAFFRKLVQIVFGFQTLVFLPALPIAIYVMATRGVYNLRVPVTGLYTATGVLSAIGVVYLGAWWTLKQGRESMRRWGLAASIVNLLLSLPLLFVPHLPTANLLWSLPISGVAGLYLFLMPTSETSVAAARASTSRMSRVAGDATNPVLDVLVWVLGGGCSIYVELWCLAFLRDNGIWYPHGLALYAEDIGLILIATFIHEFGHAFGGWSVGMKLRHFAFGPFQFHLRDGKWEFNFESGKILGGGGSTGNVPSGPEHQVWHSLLMVVAGPAINIGIGIIALGLGMTTDPGSSLQWGGAMMMFGVPSLVLGAFNLLPFRTGGGGYSDGARILQLLNGGPAADIYFAMSLVSSSLVTSMRPAEYDMDLLERAAGPAQGVQRIFLLLFQYQHHLDLDNNMDQTREAFARVESAYREWSGDVPASLLQSMAFGAACVKGDAAAARRYWGRMEEEARRSKEPLRRNADYWIAQSAVYWSERNIQEANTAWERGAVLAHRLPAAGAYDFDRYKYIMLREAMEAHSDHVAMVAAIRQPVQPAWDAAF